MEAESQIKFLVVTTFWTGQALGVVNTGFNFEINVQACFSKTVTFMEIVAFRCDFYTSELHRWSIEVAPVLKRHDDSISTKCLHKDEMIKSCGILKY